MLLHSDAFTFALYCAVYFTVPEALKENSTTYSPGTAGLFETVTLDKDGAGQVAILQVPMHVVAQMVAPQVGQSEQVGNEQVAIGPQVGLAHVSEGVHEPFGAQVGPP